MMHDHDVNATDADRHAPDVREAGGVNGPGESDGAGEAAPGGSGRPDDAGPTTRTEAREARGVYDVVVVGAGQAGLATAGELVRRGLTPGRDLLVLDAEDGPGGSWQHRWDSLRVGRSARIANLLGLPVGDLDESAPSNVVVPDYLNRYEESLGLEVLRPVRVTAVRSTDIPAPALALGGAHSESPSEPSSPAAPGQDSGTPARTRMGRRRDAVRRDTLLAVETETDEGPRTWLTRTVVSASGTWTHPYVPHVAGREDFTGLQLHTSTYRRAEDLTDRRVLVVGGGLSAVRMILEIAPHAASVVWATRRPPSFTSSGFADVWGAAVAPTLAERTGEGADAPTPVDADAVTSATTRVGRRRARRRSRAADVAGGRSGGVPTPAEYVDGVERGLLVSRGMIDLVTEHGVRFSPSATGTQPDGLAPDTVTGGGVAVPGSWSPYDEPTEVEVDAIFWNTGFRPALTHLTPLRLRERDAESRAERGETRGDPGIPVVGGTEAAKDPRVFLVGYGSQASTRGARRAGTEAARRIWRRLRG